MNIAAVIVTFNRKELLKEVLESVLKNNISHIYIIDNNSSDGTQEYITEYIIENNYAEIVSYYKTAENTGGAGGFNKGVKIACESEKYDWLWLMDDDICPEGNTLDIYKKFIINSNEKIGALMGLRFYKGKAFTFEGKSHDFNNYKKGFKNNGITPDELNNKVIEIADFPFEGPLLNVEVIKEIGYPNPDFFIIGDDTDYAIRINQVAKSYMLTDARLNRLLTPYTDMSEYTFNWKDYYLLRNVIYLNKLYGENFPVKYLRSTRAFLSAIKKNYLFSFKNKQFKNIKKTKYIWLAFYHGMTGKLGKTYVPGDF